LRTLALTACGCSFAVSCPDEETTTLVGAALGGLLARSRASVIQPVISYRVERAAAPHAYRVHAANGSTTAFADADSLVFFLDKALTLALQRQRPDLYFLHAAAVARGDWVGVLPAPPHTGKSTLTLALLERGFTYLSDELAPLDADRLLVHPYPHAVCLKSHPPEAVRMPAGTVRTGMRFHVPCGEFAGGVAKGPRPLSAFMFLRRPSPPSAPALRRVGAAAGAARLMANGLNALAHPNAGLDVAVNLAQRVPCFEVDTHDLAEACARIEEISRDSSPAPQEHVSLV
jgi:hypothetical protein